jgi:hypothetical protein
LLACAACKPEASPEVAAETAAKVPLVAEAVPSAPRFDRIVRAELPAFGRQPGFVVDGVLHVALRPRAVLGWLRTIPLPEDAARDLAELAGETGVDWRAEDLQRRFALAPDAVISMTFLRPITSGASSLRGQLARGGTVVKAAQRVWPEIGEGSVVEATKPIEAPPTPPTEPTVAPPPVTPTGDPSTIETPIVEAPIMPVEAIPPATLEEARTVLRGATGMGFHSRMVVPVTDPEPLLQWMRGLVPARASSRIAALCPSLPQARLCFADNQVAVVVRADAGSVTADVVVFMLSTQELSSEQEAAIRASIELRPIESGRATELRGDAAITVDAAVLVALAELVGLRRATSGIRWNDAEPGEGVRRSLDGITAIERLASAPLLFTGAQLELGIGEGDRVQLEARWLAPAERRAENDALLASGPSRAQVPSYAALCDGAVICVRTRGLPRPSTLSERLATGAWAADPNEFERTFESNEELAALHMLVASWPNLLGAAARWPAMEIGDGPEGAMARNLVDVLGRIEGFGGSVRSFSLARRTVQADYAVYARTTAQDAGIVRGMLSLAGEAMAEVTISGIEGPMFSWTIPEDELAATVISRVDPPGLLGGTSERGWIAVVDGADRMGWLLGLPQESPEGPAAYVELPDLARALPTQPEIERELGFLRGFFGGLRLRAMLDVDAGEPRVTAVLSRAAP